MAKQNKTSRHYQPSLAGASSSAQCEDPWDVQMVGRHCSRVAVATTFWPSAGLQLVVFLLLWVLVFSTVRGQSVPPPVEEPESAEHRYHYRMNRETFDLARDYLDLLEQVRYLSDDYRHYYRELGSAQARISLAQLSEASQMWLETAMKADYSEIVKQLADWEIRLAKEEVALGRNQVSNATRDLRTQEEIADELKYQKQELEILKEEMDELRTEFDKTSDADIAEEMTRIEAEVIATRAKIQSLQAGRGEEDTSTGGDHHLYYVTRGLHRELAMVRSLLEDDIYPRLESDDAVREAISEYVRQAVAAGRTDSGERRVIEVVVFAPGIGSTEVQITKLELDDLLLSLEAAVSEIENVPEVENIPGIPEDLPEPSNITVHVDIGPRQRQFVDPGGAFVMVQEYNDSIDIVSVDVPVIIVNPIGNLIVRGWDRDYLLTECVLEVGADSEAKARDLVERMDVRLYERQDAVYVEASAPDLSDPMIRVNRRQIRIWTPTGNRIVVKSGFGEIDISKIKGGLRLSSNNAPVTIDHVEGQVEIASKMGRVDLSHVTGPVTVSNTHKPLTLTDCLGEIQLENIHSSIELENCAGSASIRNTGPTLLNGFDGDVDIQNANGLVELYNIDGSVKAKNSLQPILVRGVSGSAAIENVRSKVVISNVRGRLIASNLFAPIRVSGSGGPVLLSNRNGDIELALTENLIGASQVTAHGGTVNLRFAAEVDLLLTIVSVGGSISSTLPIKVKAEGETRSAKVALGAANNSLAISGTNSDVVIR